MALNPRKELAMKVKDVMTVNVAAVGQDATLKQVAEAMVDRGVSGIPVVNAERHVLGVVSEADLPAAALDSKGPRHHRHRREGQDRRSRADEDRRRPGGGLRLARPGSRLGRLLRAHRRIRRP